MMAMHLNSYFVVFLAMVVGFSFILRPSNSKLADTFNQYNDLSNEDKEEG
jgi:preprotein translocase subunit YajC